MPTEELNLDVAIGVTHAPYRRVIDAMAYDGHDLIMTGHTHGGQICLPGSIPITLSSVLPRHMGSGTWNYGEMVGYTSVEINEFAFNALSRRLKAIGVPLAVEAAPA